MENTRTSLWAYIGDFARAVFGNEEPDKQNEEELSDIPESYCKDNNVTKEQMEVLKESDAKLSEKKLEKPEKKEEKINNFVQRNYKSGNAGGNQGKSVVGSKEAQAPEKPDNELTL